jgi:hypothetical protein
LAAEVVEPAMSDVERRDWDPGAEPLALAVTDDVPALMP